MKKSWFRLGLFALVALFIYGCGASEETKVEDEAAPPPEPVVEELPPPPPPPPPVVEEPPPPPPPPPPVVEEPPPPPPPPVVEEPPPPPPPPPVVEEPEEMRAEEYPPVEEVEFDIEPIFDLLGQVVAPQDYREGLAAAPDKNVIYDKARELERELAMVSAAPQPASMGSALFKVVFFEFDRSNIKPEFRAAIEENAAALKANPNYSVIIEGHCDERGTTEYNLALGNRRATVVYDALIQMGVDPNQLETVSYGEERPAEFGHDEASWQKNRRSVISFR